MFMLHLPKSVKVGDTVNCRINLQPARVRREADALVIEPNDRRKIVSIHEDANLRTFVCAAADGSTDFEIISPDLDASKGAA